MWLKNYEVLLNYGAYFHYGNRTQTSVVDANHKVKTVSGSYQPLCMYNGGSNYGNQRTMVGLAGEYMSDGRLAGMSCIIKNEATASGYGDRIIINFGSGTTSPTRDDYNLENIITTITTITSGFSYSGSVKNNGDLELTISGTIKSTEDCVINEVSLGKYIYSYQNYSTSTTAYLTLLYRKVLDAPLTLSANQPADISFTITLPYITINQ